MPTNDQTTLLTPMQERLIAALLTQPSIRAAAKEVGIGEKTGRRWLKLPHVQEAYRAAQHEQYRSLLAPLHRGVSTALTTLYRNMTGKDVPPAVQVRAALGWLEQSLTVYRMQELEQTQAEILRKLEALGIKP